MEIIVSVNVKTESHVLKERAARGLSGRIQKTRHLDVVPPSLISAS